MDVVPGGRERGRERRGSDGRKGVRQRGREGGMEQGLDKQGVVLRIQILLHGDGGQGHKGRWQKGEQHKMSNLWNKGVWMESTRHPHSVICALATLARFPTNLHTGHTDFLTHRYTGHTHCLTDSTGMQGTLTPSPTPSLTGTRGTARPAPSASTP